MDLNKLRQEALENKEVLKDKVKEFTGKKEGETPTLDRYNDFKYATQEEKERIANDNDTTVEAFEKSLHALAIMRGELKEE
jgi:hypothetical protein